VLVNVNVRSASRRRVESKTLLFYIVRRKTTSAPKGVPSRNTNVGIGTGWKEQENKDAFFLLM
jgi:hypothetical protein